MLETVLKRFEEPDEVRTFEKGKFLVRIGGMTIGRVSAEDLKALMDEMKESEAALDLEALAEWAEKQYA